MRIPANLLGSTRLLALSRTKSLTNSRVSEDAAATNRPSKNRAVLRPTAAPATQAGEGRQRTDATQKNARLRPFPVDFSRAPRGSRAAAPLTDPTPPHPKYPTGQPTPLARRPLDRIAAPSRRFHTEKETKGLPHTRQSGHGSTSTPTPQAQAIPPRTETNHTRNAHPHPPARPRPRHHRYRPRVPPPHPRGFPRDAITATRTTSTDNRGPRARVPHPSLAWRVVWEERPEPACRLVARPALTRTAAGGAKRERKKKGKEK